MEIKIGRLFKPVQIIFETEVGVRELLCDLKQQDNPYPTSKIIIKALGKHLEEWEAEDEFI